MLGIGLSIWSRLVSGYQGSVPPSGNFLLDIDDEPLLDIDGQELEE